MYVARRSALQSFRHGAADQGIDYLLSYGPARLDQPDWTVSRTAIPALPAPRRQLTFMQAPATPPLVECQCGPVVGTAMDFPDDSTPEALLLNRYQNERSILA
jgi:hypothetical protein